MREYFYSKEVKEIPRLPEEGSIDLTYRCNNNCRHCWIRIQPASPEKNNELSFDEIVRIVDDARKMGCHKWSISGGEPMLRSDFADIFDYLTKKSITFSINTNGTYITPKIAQLMKRRGSKMIVLYGATAEVHDNVTRNPGSFDAVMQGFSYLKEAQVCFTVQLIPMKDNYHQLKDMFKLARSLSPRVRIGADWLYLSACGDTKRNKEIMRQRLSPRIVIGELMKPNLCYEEEMIKEDGFRSSNVKRDARLFKSCISNKQGFHIDPYGKMSFCQYVIYSAHRYNLREGSFKECWEQFIPSLADKIKGGSEYLENCGSCELVLDCRCCPVFSYLEHRRYSAKVEYLCAVAKECRRYKEIWKKKHRRYYQIAGISIQVDSDLPITKNTFHEKFKYFEVEKPGNDKISIRHHFALPELNSRNLGKEVYRKTPWAIFKKDDSWLYLGISNPSGNTSPRRIAVFNLDHTKVRIYNSNKINWHRGKCCSLTLFASDRILVARILADREGCYIHSSGVIFEGKGLLFVGNSGAGKSIIARMLKNKAKILCDDQIIVRRHPEGFRIHGTWSNGEIPFVSSSSALLKAIFFLEKDEVNKIVPIYDNVEVVRKLLASLIRPLVDKDWWEKMLSLVEKISRGVSFYTLHFDKSGKIVDLLSKI